MSNHEVNNPAETGRGRYVQGEYGKAGVEGNHLPGDPEGRYVEGDYGEAGVESIEEDTGSGRFVEADYGTAGDVPARSAEDESQGRYVDSEPGDVKKNN